MSKERAFQQRQSDAEATEHAERQKKYARLRGAVAQRAAAALDAEKDLMSKRLRRARPARSKLSFRIEARGTDVRDTDTSRRAEEKALGLSPDAQQDGNDPFVYSNGYSWDYVLVLPGSHSMDDLQKYRRAWPEEIIKKVRSAGCETFVYESMLEHEGKALRLWGTARRHW